MPRRFTKATYSRRTYAEMVRIKERAFRDLEAALIREKALKQQLRLMAKLAKCQEEPQFSSPLEAMAAVTLRDQILKGD